MDDSTHRKLDPALNQIARKEGTAESLRMNVASFNEEALPTVSVLISFKGEREELAALGVSISSFNHGIATGTVPVAWLRALADDPRIEAIEAARALNHELDISGSVIGANQVRMPPLSLTGRGVIIGIVDTGIDLWHASFRRSAGRSAVLAVWDQTLAAAPGESLPKGFSYGVEYEQAQIERAFAAGPDSNIVRHRDSLGHGTHVAAIAAGSATPYIGIAPDADLLVVATSTDAKALGDSARTLDAIRYIFEKAAGLGRPAVINLSLGSYIGPHDGTSLLERGIDALLKSPGQILVKAAGNAGGAGSHASGSLAAGEATSLRVEVPATSTESATIDIWYNASGRFQVTLSAPDGTATSPLDGDEIREYFLPGDVSVLVSSILANPGSGDNRIYVVVSPGSTGQITPGLWAINLKAVTASEKVRFDAWIERGSNPPRFSAANADENMTISVPGTARRCITVSAYAASTAGHTPSPTIQLLPTSSRGPTRDGRRQPEIAAPGGWIASARSAKSKLRAYGDAAWTLMSGTSMAAPHVTGAVALLLQQEPGLDSEQVRERLQKAVKPAPLADRDGWGEGALHLAKMFTQPTTPKSSIEGPSIQVVYNPAGPPPTFKVQTGANAFYAVEIAREPALFATAGQAARVYTDTVPVENGLKANFFASWRGGPLQSGATYTLPQTAWEALRDAPRLFYRIVTSAAADSWNAVSRSTSDQAVESAPALLLKPLEQSVEAVSTLPTKSFQQTKQKGK
jgi:subtilisin family serine protease